jgi:hypothetical protein
MLVAVIATVCCHSMFSMMVIPHCLCYLNLRMRGRSDHRLQYCNDRLDPSPLLAHPTPSRRGTTPSSPVRVAWGIVSRPEDVAFRQTLRNTYLAEDPRICPLSAFDNRIADESPDLEHCQIAYSFVVLGKRFRRWGDRQMKKEKDVIKFDSNRWWRSPSVSQWFHHASRYGDVDYVARASIQTLLIPSTFLTMINELLDNPHLRHVFAGQPIDRLTCGGVSETVCRKMVGQTAMSPDLYFISRDLAFHTPPSLERSHDDAHGVSNWLYGMKRSPILQLTLNPTEHGLWEKGPDDPVKFQKRWDELKQHGFRKDLLKDFTPRPTWGGLEHLYSLL